LPDNDSYRTYADLGRPFVLWNVVAADEFSVKPKESCFPVAGCVAYRGFYAERAAHEYADQLARQGEDVFVYGVPAYSTLGWFADPLLNTFINYPRTEVARMLFHELAHQVVYVKGDSAFNESFAVAVEDEGVRRWIAMCGSDRDQQEYEAMQERREGFNDLVMRYQAKLSAIYASGLDKAHMREAKQQAFAEMKQSYLALRESWHGWSGYDRWFAQDLNNAHLASVATYTEWVGAFHNMIEQEKGDLPAFYGEVRALARLDKAQRDARLENSTRPL
jgi:predicted aminopeptidase